MCIHIYIYIFSFIFFLYLFFFFFAFLYPISISLDFPFFFCFLLVCIYEVFYRIPEQLRDPVIRCYTALGKCSGSGCNFYFFFFNSFSRCEKYLAQTKGKIALVSMAASRLTLPQRWLPIADRKKKEKRKKIVTHRRMEKCPTSNKRETFQLRGKSFSARIVPWLTRRQRIHCT